MHHVLGSRPVEYVDEVVAAGCDYGVPRLLVPRAGVEVVAARLTVQAVDGPEALDQVLPAPAADGVALVAAYEPVVPVVAVRVSASAAPPTATSATSMTAARSAARLPTIATPFWKGAENALVR